MMKTILLSVMMTPALLWPQTPEQTAPAPITKIVRVHNANAEKLANMVRTSAVSVLADNALKALVVRGKPTDVATVEQTIHELDSSSTPVASRNVELMVYIVSGSNATPTPSAPAEKLEALTPVVKQLRVIFPYSDYQLLSTMLLRSGEGTMTTSNGLLRPFQSSGAGRYPSVYSISFDSATVSQEGARPSIHLRKFRFDTRFSLELSATEMHNYDAGTQTDVDLQEGQKVVVGKANIETADSAIFVILSAKLMQ